MELRYFISSAAPIEMQSLRANGYVRAIKTRIMELMIPESFTVDCIRILVN